MLLHGTGEAGREEIRSRIDAMPAARRLEAAVV
jgi:hypothetical protein